MLEALTRYRPGTARGQLFFARGADDHNPFCRRYYAGMTTIDIIRYDRHIFGLAREGSTW